MAPDGPCVSPPTAPSRTTEGFLAIVPPPRLQSREHSQSVEVEGGGVGWMRLVWVL